MPSPDHRGLTITARTATAQPSIARPARRRSMLATPKSARPAANRPTLAEPNACRELERCAARCSVEWRA
ncbi:hypothetical protein AAHH79_44410, partial [Burkholderia pseudomallei]